MNPEDLFKGNAKGCWYETSHGVFDIRGRYHVFNEVRKVTWWRKLRARLGFAEKDTLLANRGHHPKLGDINDRSKTRSITLSILRP